MLDGRLEHSVGTLLNRRKRRSQGETTHTQLSEEDTSRCAQSRLNIASLLRVTFHTLLRFRMKPHAPRFLRIKLRTLLIFRMQLHAPFGFRMQLHAPLSLRVQIHAALFSADLTVTTSCALLCIVKRRFRSFAPS
jgi:hypothetical protein